MSNPEKSSEDKNLWLWNSVTNTEPKYVEKGVGIDEQDIAHANTMYFYYKATKLWGPHGVWGLTNIQHKIVELPNTTAPFLLVVTADFYYPTKKGKTASFSLSTSVKLVSFFSKEGKNGKIEQVYQISHGAYESAETDLIVEALSRLGFERMYYFRPDTPESAEVEATDDSSDENSDDL